MRSGGICGGPRESGGDIMPVTVKTFATSGEAAAALSVGTRGALSRRRHAGHARAQRGRCLGFDCGAGDRPRSERVSTSRVPASCSGPASPSCGFSASANSASFILSRVRSAVRLCAIWARSAAICSRQRRSVISRLRACARRDRMRAGRLWCAGRADEEFLAGRGRMPGGLVLSVSFQRPSSAEAFRYRKVARIRPKGGSVVTLAAHVAFSGGRVVGVRIALGAMAVTAVRAKGAVPS